MTRHRKTPLHPSSFGIPEKFIRIVRRCNHTLYHRTNDGPLQGTWIEQHGPYGTRVVCRICRKFYGYLPLENDLVGAAVYDAYLQQRDQH